MTLVMLIVLALFVAGIVKGIFGMGLPTISIGLLSLMIAPVEAAVLVAIPTLVTNAWQFATGHTPLVIARRFLTLLIGVVIGTTLGVGFLTGLHTDAVSLALGVVLMLYAAIGLLGSRLSITDALARRLAPLIGLATGVVNGATGVSVMPLVPYLNSLQLERDALVQAMGLVFMIAIVTLAACLAWTGHFHTASLTQSLLACVPAFAGTYAGQLIRQRLPGDEFRRWFFFGLLALGAYSAGRALLRGF